MKQTVYRNENNHLYKRKQKPLIKIYFPEKLTILVKDIVFYCIVSHFYCLAVNYY